MLLVADEKNYVLITEPKAKVLVAGGTQGLPGTGGTGSAATHEITAVAAQDGAMTVALPNINVAAGLEVYINGLKQIRAAYSATSTLLTLPASLNIMTGDVINAVFQL